MTAPQVSVLLTSWNTREDTRRCLESLHRNADGVTYEVIAVDNGSVDGSAELLAADPVVTLIRNRRNVGFAPAVNQAHRAATGELILLLNSDICFESGSLRKMVKFLAHRPDAAGVSPLYLNPDGSFQQHYIQLPSFAACLALWTVLKRVPGFRGPLHRFQMRGQDFSQPRELSSGSCLLLRGDIFRDRPIFDEAFPIYWNDAILIRELQDAGRHLWMIPDAVVTHVRGASCRLLGPAIRFRHLLGGLVCYLRLTEPAYRVLIFRVLVMADYGLKTLFARTTALGWSDLRAALRGDVGPLPDGDARNWKVIVGQGAAFSDAASSHAQDDIRLLLVDPAGSRRQRGRRIEQTSPSVWRARLPTALPFGDRVPLVKWLNGRVAAARLRRWLDRYPGARTLHVDAPNAYLVGWLGEDFLASVDRENLSGAPLPQTDMQVEHG